MKIRGEYKSEEGKKYKKRRMKISQNEKITSNK